MKKQARSILVAACVLVGGAAHASYELLFAVDSTAKVVRRYDPITGTSLGTFGQGLLNTPASVVANSDGTAWVLETIGSADRSVRFKLFNYSTGTLLRVVSTSLQNWGFASADAQLAVLGNRLIASEGGVNLDGSFVVEWDQSGNRVRYHGGTSTTPMIGVAIGNGGQHVYRAMGTKIYWNGINDPSDNSNNALGTVTQGANIRHLVTVGSELYSINQAGALTRYSIAANGALTQTGSVTLTGFSTSSTHGIAVGHDRTIFVGGTDLATPTNGRILRVDGRTLDILGAVNTVGLSSGLRGMDLVVAPEPGTMAALAVGVAALLRRRKR